MKKSELRIPLRVATALLTIGSVVTFVGGCLATKGGISGDKSSFRPEYYAARQLQNEDIVKLRELTISTDPFVADSATLLLGSYYLYYGDKNYGRILINRTYNSPNLKNEIKTFGKLWQMESLMSENKVEEAALIGEEIKTDKHTEEYLRAMVIYCNQLNFKIENSEDVNACIDSVVKGQERNRENNANSNEYDTPINTDNMTYDEYLTAIGLNKQSPEKEETPVEDTIKEIDTTSELDLIDGDLFSDIASGIIMSMKNNENDFQLKPISAMDAESSDSKMSIDVKNYHVRIGSETVNLAPDFDVLAEYTSQLKILRNKDIVIVVSGNSTYEKGKKIIDYLKPSIQDKSQIKKDKVKEVYLFNFSSGYQKSIQSVLSGKDELKYAIILLGRDDEVSEMIPIAKYWQYDKSIHDIIVTTSFITPFKYIDKEYEKYYQDFSILTHGYLNENATYLEQSNEYEKIHGKSMSADNILGYDMITYINSYINKSGNPKYISNIKEIKNGNAYRNVYLHYVDKTGIYLKKEYEVKYVEPVENSQDNGTVEVTGEDKDRTNSN